MLIQRRVPVATLANVGVGVFAWDRTLPDGCVGCGAQRAYPVPIQAGCSETSATGTSARAILVTFPMCVPCMQRATVSGMGGPVGCGGLLGFVGFTAALALAPEASFGVVRWPLALGTAAIVSCAVERSPDEQIPPAVI